MCGCSSAACLRGPLTPLPAVLVVAAFFLLLSIHTSVTWLRFAFFLFSMDARSLTLAVLQSRRSVDARVCICVPGAPDGGACGLYVLGVKPF